MGSQMKDEEDSGPQIFGFIPNFKFQHKIKKIYKHEQTPFEIIKVQLDHGRKILKTFVFIE